jgi:hypothetical protein
MKTHDREHFFKYATAGTAQAILGNLTIRWSSPLLFNDPYDARCDWASFFHIDGEFVEAVLPFIEGYLVTDEPLPEAMPSGVRLTLSFARAARSLTTTAVVVAAVRETLLLSMQRQQADLRAYNDLWMQVLRNTRILCVSEIASSVKMWSHYAQNHEGAVLRLQCIQEEDTALCAARPVVYSPTPPVIADRDAWIRHILGIQRLDLSRIAQTIVFTKGNDWSEEREWRCWLAGDERFRDGPFFEAFKLIPREVGALYLGCRMREEERRALIGMLSGSLAHVEVWQGMLRRAGYGVEFERVL